jgi:hypothetical protein
MYRFTRHATLKYAGDMPSALQFSSELTLYLNKTYSLNMKSGAEMFGGSRLYFFYDIESLDAIAQFNAKLMQDRLYLDMLNKAKNLWREGSMQDCVVKIIA